MGGLQIMKEYIMALDQGTTSSRCILFDHAGKIVTMAQKEFTQIYPAAGLGRAESEGNLVLPDVGCHRGNGEYRGIIQKYPCHWHHKPARNHNRLG